MSSTSRRPVVPPSSNGAKPLVTSFRLLVSLLTTIFGISKAALSYKGQLTASTTLEWVFGVVLALGLFWLAAIPESRPDALPWLFDSPTASSLHRVREPEVTKPLVTGYRLLVSLITVIFGMIKAALSYQNKSAAATTLDWIFGIVLTLGLFWLAAIHESRPHSLRWLFDSSTDSLRYNREPQIAKPLVTGYRLIVSLLTVAFGTSKAVLSYQNKSAAATTLDWVFGIILTLGLFWLAAIPDSSPNALPWLFEADLYPIGIHLAKRSLRKLTSGLIMISLVIYASSMYLGLFFPILTPVIVAPHIAFIERPILTALIFLTNCVTALGYHLDFMRGYWERIVPKRISHSSWPWYETCVTMWVAWHIATLLICQSSVYGGDLLAYLDMVSRAMTYAT